MSNEKNVDKNARRDDARAKALAIKQQQERSERRSRMVILISAIAGIAVVVILAAFILRQAPSTIDKSITTIPADVESPAAADKKDGSFALYKDQVVDKLPEGVPVFDLYLDFMCSHCAVFESMHSDFLTQKQSAGDLVYRVHPIAILGFSEAFDRGSTYVAMLNKNVKEAQEFAKWAFANQTDRSMDSDAQAKYLESIGVSAADAKDAASNKYKRFIEASSYVTLNNPDLRDESGGFGTPALFMNNKRVDVNYTDVPAFQQYIDQTIAAAKK